MPGRRVLEIGPGLGFLTGGLLAAGATVTAVELDRGMAAFLRDTFAAEVEEERLRLIEGDALDQDLVGLVRTAVRRRREPAVPDHEPGPPPPARAARRVRISSC